MQVVVMMLCWFTVHCVRCNDPETDSQLSFFKFQITCTFNHFAITCNLSFDSRQNSSPFFPLFHFALSMRTSFVFFFWFFRNCSSSRIPNTFDARLTYCSHAFVRLPFLSMIIFFRSIFEWNPEQEKKNSFEWEMLFDKRFETKRKG